MRYAAGREIVVKGSDRGHGRKEMMMQSVKECYIKCRISGPGMFSDEVTVEIRALDAQGKVITVRSIMPERAIEREKAPSDHGRLRATCLGRSRHRTAVVLPQPTLENGPSLLVPNEEIVSSRAGA